MFKIFILICCGIISDIALASGPDCGFGGTLLNPQEKIVKTRFEYSSMNYGQPQLSCLVSDPGPAQRTTESVKFFLDTAGWQSLSSLGLGSAKNCGSTEKIQATIDKEGSFEGLIIFTTSEYWETTPDCDPIRKVGFYCRLNLDMTKQNLGYYYGTDFKVSSAQDCFNLAEKL